MVAAIINHYGFAQSSVKPDESRVVLNKKRQAFLQGVHNIWVQAYGLKI